MNILSTPDTLWPFEDTLQFTVTKAGASLIGSLLGGEGLVCRFSGQGRLFCQSHNPPSFGKAARSETGNLCKRTCHD
ncbi:MAG: AIM24 family protein [Planctomycetaceae bacterium]